VRHNDFNSLRFFVENYMTLGGLPAFFRFHGKKP